MNELDWQLLEDKTPLDSIQVGETRLTLGSRVRLKPFVRGDIFDIALRDKVATIESIEQTYEDQIQLAVVIDDDPGRDLGMLKQPGHRFFFSLSEIEPLSE